MRLFLAINPPARVRQGIWNATASVRDAGPYVKWVAEARLHLTLKFLGEQPESAAAPLVETIRAVGSTHLAPAMRVGELGAFPNFRRARVVWIGVDPDPRLELLHHDIEVACDRLGHAIEGRPFRPHITLGRVTERVGVDELRALRSAAKKVRFTDEFTVTSIDMMQSTPGAAGSAYTTLASATLRGL